LHNIPITGVYSVGLYIHTPSNYDHEFFTTLIKKLKVGKNRMGEAQPPSI